jgi:hypothetical protein
MKKLHHEASSSSPSTESKDVGLSFWNTSSIVATVAASDFLKPLAPFTVWLLVFAGAVFGLGFIWKTAARIRLLAGIGFLVFLGVLILQWRDAPRTGPNPGVIATHVQAAAFLQAKALPLDPTTRTLLELDAGLNSSNPGERMAALQAALATRNADLRREAIQTALHTGDAQIRETAVLEALSSRTNTNLSLDPDSGSADSELGRVVARLSLRVWNVNKNSGGFGGQLTCCGRGAFFDGTVSLDGGTVISAKLEPWMGVGEANPPIGIIIKVHPTDDLRLAGVARTSDGQSCSLSIPLL